MIRQEFYHEELRTFREAVEVKNALIRQIVAAVDDQFLEELKDEQTNNIDKSIPEILAYLFANFADVTLVDVKREEEKVKEHFWNISEPPMSFYTIIEDFQKIATAAGVPRTEKMLINYGMDIIQKTNDFEVGVLEWNRKAEADKTWQTFKRHFSTVHRDLRKARGETMKNTSFHQAHNMAQDITASIEDLRTELRQSIASIANQSPVTHHSTSHTTPMSSLSPTANSATSDELLKLVLQLQNQLLTTKPPIDEPPKPPKRPFVRNQTDKYCWSHGACGHDGKDCRNKKPGHRDEATFANRLGGSTFFCKQAEDKANANN